MTRRNTDPAPGPSPEAIQTGRHGPLVVGIDGGQSTGRVLEVAASDAELLGLPIVVLHISRPPAFSHGLAEITPAMLDTLAEDCHIALFPDVVEALGRREIIWSLITRRGDPVGLLTSLARDLDAHAIIVGSHTPGVIGRLRCMAGRTVAARLVRRPFTRVHVVPCQSPRPR